MPTNESREMYLEAIHVLSKTKGVVRSIDIAEYMNYSKPSVSRGVGLLKENGYIVVDKDGLITLTATGLELAERVFEKHTILTKILMELGVDEDVAQEDACRIEHAISDISFEAIKRRYLEGSPETK